MANGTTMNAALFEALRDAGIAEEKAAKVAKTIPAADTIATKAELDKVAASIPDPGSLPSKAEVGTLKAESDDTKGHIKDIRDDIAEVKSDIAVAKANSQYDRKLLFVILGVVLAVAAGVFQILLSN